MDRKNLDRYKRILLEKRGEMSVATAETESPIPAAGGQRGDPVDQANADAGAEPSDPLASNRCSPPASNRRGTHSNQKWNVWHLRGLPKSNF